MLFRFLILMLLLSETGLHSQSVTVRFSPNGIQAGQSANLVITLSGTTQSTSANVVVGGTVPGSDVRGDLAGFYQAGSRQVLLNVGDNTFSVTVFNNVAITGTRNINATANIGTASGQASLTVSYQDQPPVGTKPVITAQPRAFTAAPGSDVSFTVAASGSEPLAFTWRKDTIPVPGSNSSTLILRDIHQSETGSYDVLVNNPFGNSQSQPAELDVLPEDATLTNQVLALNGSTSYVTIPSSNDLQPLDAITVEAWVLPSGSGKGFFIDKGDSGFVDSPRTYELFWEPGIGVTFNLFLGTNIWASIATTAEQGRWVHIAGSFNSAEGLIKIYKDGVLAASKSTDASGTVPLIGKKIRRTTLPLVFGAELTHPFGFASGNLDEVRIWNLALSDQAIAARTTCRLTGLEKNLVGYWPFDDGTANDFTVRGHNGVLAGGATIQAADSQRQNVLRCDPIVVENEVLSLNGAGSYVAIPTSPELQNSNAITVSAWIYPTVTSGNKFGTFINIGDGASGDSQRTYEARWRPENTLSFGFYFMSQSGSPDFVELFAPVYSNQWTHFAATFDGEAGNARLYTNALLATEISGLTGRTIRQTTSPLIIGWTPNYPDVYASGSIDDIRVWSKALTPLEIAKSIHLDISAIESYLAGSWSFEDGTAADNSGHEHNGTLIGSAQVNESGRLSGPLKFNSLSLGPPHGSLVLLTVPGLSYRIDSSTNLSNWAPVATVTSTNGIIEVGDPDAGVRQSIFYRGVLSQP